MVQYEKREEIHIQTEKQNRPTSKPITKTLCKVYVRVSQCLKIIFLTYFVELAVDGSGS